MRFAPEVQVDEYAVEAAPAQEARPAGKGAAALATISVIEEEHLLEAAKEKGQWLVDTIKSRQSAYPEIKEIRGKGLMVGVELNREAKPVVLKMMEHKVLGNATADTVVRWVPPLNIPQEDLEAALNVFFLSLEETR